MPKKYEVHRIGSEDAPEAAYTDDDNMRLDVIRHRVGRFNIHFHARDFSFFLSAAEARSLIGQLRALGVDPDA